MVVVLPAPFGPSKPKISPARMSKVTPCTATNSSVWRPANGTSFDQRDAAGLALRLVKTLRRPRARKTAGGTACGQRPPALLDAHVVGAKPGACQQRGHGQRQHDARPPAPADQAERDQRHVGPALPDA